MQKAINESKAALYLCKSLNHTLDESVMRVVIINQSMLEEDEEGSSYESEVDSSVDSVYDSEDDSSNYSSYYDSSDDFDSSCASIGYDEE